MRILIEKNEYENLENFLEVIIETTKSDYNKKYRRIHIKEDIITGEVVESDMPNEEATSYMCSKIRPFLLKQDKYTKIITSLRKIIVNEESNNRKKHEALIRKSEKYIEGILKQKDSAFGLYMYGKYVKVDCDKRKIIKHMPKTLEAGFHHSLEIIFRSLASLANLYLWLKKEYNIEVKDSNIVEPASYSFGI